MRNQYNCIDSEYADIDIRACYVLVTYLLRIALSRAIFEMLTYHPADVLIYCCTCDLFNLVYSFFTNE